MKRIIALLCFASSIFLSCSETSLNASNRSNKIDALLDSMPLNQKYLVMEMSLQTCWECYMIYPQLKRASKKDSSLHLFLITANLNQAELARLEKNSGFKPGRTVHYINAKEPYIQLRSKLGLGNNGILKTSDTVRRFEVKTEARELLKLLD